MKVPLKRCPTCLAEVTSLIMDIATRRQFCFNCGPSCDATYLARKIQAHNQAGTLHTYSIEERLKDLKTGPVN
jgi:hypothetical protein